MNMISVDEDEVGEKTPSDLKEWPVLRPCTGLVIHTFLEPGSNQ